jgi:hypothetical protein
MLRSTDRAIKWRGSASVPPKSLFIDFANGITPEFGGTSTFTRSTIRTVTTGPDGLVETLLSGEMGIQGGRRVDNLIRGAINAGEQLSENIAGYLKPGLATTTGATQVNFGSAGVNVVSSTHTLGNSLTYRVRCKMRGTSGNLVNLYFADNATATKGGGIQITLTADYRIYSFLVTVGAAVETYGLFVDTRSFFALGVATPNQSFDWTDIQFENVTGRTVTAPSEYVPVGTGQTPFGVDGVRYFTYANGNTVNSNVVTEAQGAALPNVLGFIAEPQRTNPILQSANLGDAAWAKVGVTVTDNVNTSPDGTVNADQLNEDTSTDNHFVSQSATKAASSLTYVCSAWVRQVTGSRNTAILLTDAVGANGGLVIINPSTGAVVSAPATFGVGWSAPSVLVDSPVNSWYRIRFQITSDTSAIIRFYCQLANGVSRTYTGDGTSRVGIWGVTVQETTALTYIPTTSAAVTRNNDVHQITHGGSIVSSNCTLSFPLWTPLVVGSFVSAIWGSYVDANNSTTLFHDGATNTLIFRKRVAGVNYDATTALTPTAGTSYDITARHSSALGTDVFLNNVQGTTNANTLGMQLASTFQVSTDGNSITSGSVCNRTMFAWTSALTNAQIATI